MDEKLQHTSRIWSPCRGDRACFALAAVVLLGILGCREPDQGPNPPASSSDAASQGKIHRIGVSQCSLSEPWHAQMDADIRAEAAKHPQLEVVFKDAENDTARQRQHIEELTADRVDLLIISPKQSQPLTEPVAAAHDAGIPVIVLDRPLIGDKYTCFIGADQKKIGHAAGQWLVQQLDGKGSVVELKDMDSPLLENDRRAGFREALKHHPGMRVLFEVDTKGLQSNAQKEMASVLTRFSDLRAVFAHSDAAAHGAYLAAADAGHAKSMLFVSIGALPQQGLAYLKQGSLSAAIESPTGGKEAIDVALKILAGQQVPRQIRPAFRLFTPANVASGGTQVP